MLKAFFGYRKPNLGIARRIVSTIDAYPDSLMRIEPPNEDSFIRVFFDQHMRAGVEWQAIIERELQDADLMFVLVTADLLGDDHSFLRTREIPIAEQRKIPIIPIVYESVLTQFEMSELAKRNAIPEGGSPAHVGSEEAWMDAVVLAVQKRCRTLLRQTRLSDADQVVAALRAVRSLAADILVTLDRAESACSSDVMEMIKRALSVAIDVSDAPNHALAADLRLISDRLLWLKDELEDDLRALISTLRGALDDARIAALRADYPLSLGNEVSAERGSIPREVARLEASLHNSNQLAEETKNAGARTSVRDAREFSVLGARQVKYQGTVAQLGLSAPRIDAGLVANTVLSAHSLAETLLRSILVTSRDEELTYAAEALASGTAAAAAAARLLVRAALDLSGPTPSSRPLAVSPAQTPTTETDPGIVFSPMVGTVYLSPDEDSPAFVKEGDKVAEGQTLMLVEAMKTFNHIPAPRAGVVKRILVSSRQPVEFGERLLILE